MVVRTRIRGAALALSGFAQWIANFAVTFTFPKVLLSFGLGTAYGMYTFFAFVSVLFVVKGIEETKGKTLEEME